VAAQGGFRVGRYISVEGNMGPIGTAVPMMLFDLICRSCGGCAQRAWDPAEAVGVTRCSACDAGMSVTGIDFPHGREAATLTSVQERQSFSFSSLAAGGDSYSISTAHLRYGRVYDILTHPRIVACIKDLIGENVIAWGSHFFCKMPGDGKRVSWHQDSSY